MFKKEMGAAVRLELTQEEGRVIGRAEYDFAEPTYMVRYVDGEGCQREAWFNESALA